MQMARRSARRSVEVYVRRASVSPCFALPAQPTVATAHRSDWSPHTRHDTSVQPSVKEQRVEELRYAKRLFGDGVTLKNSSVTLKVRRRHRYRFQHRPSAPGRARTQPRLSRAQEMLEHTMANDAGDGMLHADPRWNVRARAKGGGGGWCSVL